jgi:hypothetical protein
MIKNTIIIILLIIHTFLCMMAGFYAGVDNTERKAYENGHMTIERVGDKRNYRWIETHKLGYDYDE